MGKSSKKVKNERINMIRKQYDAFLEEDKKRRERNEYILGKLDKMRSSTALVPVSIKANYHQEVIPSDIYMRPDKLPKNSSVYDNYPPQLQRPKMALNILNKNVDESSILTEISKKYILIPRSRALLGQEYIYHKENEDVDWRSKYNILDDLKKQEKEGQPDGAIYKNNEAYKDSEISTDRQSHNPDHFEKPLFNSTNDLPEINKYNALQEEQKNKSDVNQKFEISDMNSQEVEENKVQPLQTVTMLLDGSLQSNIIEPITKTDTDTYEVNQAHQEYITEKERYNSDIKDKNEAYLTENYNNNSQINEGTVDSNNYQETVLDQTNCNNLSNETTNYEETVSAQQNYDNLSYDNRDYKSPEEAINNSSMQLASDNEQRESVNLEEDKTEVIEKPEPRKETPNIKDSPSTEEVALYNVENNPEGHVISNPNEITYDPAQHQDNQGNAPVMLEKTDQPEQVNHDSEINAFDAEQNEMFYSEETGGDSYAYIQGDSNTGEYPTGGYEQNEQYAYYEGVQQEQAYDAINEHEESTERYDPHYSQQYEGTYEDQQPDNTLNYEGANTYDQSQYQEGSYENQQYENVANYENQRIEGNYQPETVSDLQDNILVPEYDQHLYSEQVDTQEHIEQQLVREEGYNENILTVSGVEGENIVETEPVMNIVTPAGQSDQNKPLEK